MIRTTSLAALTLALMSAAAVAQPVDGPNAPPAQLSNPNNYQNQYQGQNQSQEQYPDQSGPQDQRGAPGPQSAQDQRSRDMFCRRDAAARTGYVTPGQAASHEQTNGTVLGTLAGAGLGAAIGAAAGNAGAGAAIGAGAGLIGGTAVGADNARQAANDVQRNYASAYYACMGEADNGPDEADYNTAGGYGPPPPGGYPPGAYPPGAYYPPPPPPGYYGYGPYPYPYYPYYGPSVGFSFGFGGHRGYHRHW